MSEASLESRLETGELVHFPATPFPLPTESDRAFLLEQRLAGQKEIHFDPATMEISGFEVTSSVQADRLQRVMQGLYQQVHGWLASRFPGYAAAWRPELARLHVEEEVTRQVRFMARNDLLHVDALFSRSTHEGRILRFFVNLHSTDPRVWVTSEKVDRLIAKYAIPAGVDQPPAQSWIERSVLTLFRPDRPPLSPYDQFLNRFHRFLKVCDELQERAPKHVWKFAPGSAWLLFSDGLSHAELRGRCVFDCTFVIAPETLEVPECSPARLWRQATSPPVRRAA